VPIIRKSTASLPVSRADAQAVIKGLDAASAEARWAAARAATNVPGSCAALAAALHREQDSRVREAIFTALARIGTPECVQELLTLLRSDDARFRTAALDALRIVARTTRDFLPGVLRDSDADVRILSCELVRGLAGEEATSLLCTLLSAEQETNVCAAALDVLAEVGNTKALTTLDECARRFVDTPFLVFAIKIARERITDPSAPPRE
jgi:HEAT repeat protein